jgi:hypothetical protein
MLSERQVFTLKDPDNRAAVLAACCDKVEVKKKVPKIYKSFMKEEYQDAAYSTYKYVRKLKLNGVEVDIKPVRGSSYRHHGIKISFDCFGETSKQLKADKDKKEKRLLNYLNKHGIPADRVCVETSFHCIYKFNEICQSCDTSSDSSCKTE